MPDDKEIRRRIDEAFAFVERVMEHPERYPDEAILFLMDPSEIASVVTKERLRILKELSERGYPSFLDLARSLDRLRPPDGRKLALDGLPFRFGEIAELHQRVDEETQPQFGRQPAGGGMRRIDQAELLEIRHHVPHRGGRERHRDQARDVARPDGLAGRQIALDDLAEDVARPLVELGEPGMRRDQADRIVVGHRILPELSLICLPQAPVTSRH